MDQSAVGRGLRKRRTLGYDRLVAARARVAAVLALDQATLRVKRGIQARRLCESTSKGRKEGAC